jgi:hypothetical protein
MYHFIIEEVGGSGHLGSDCGNTCSLSGMPSLIGQNAILKTWSIMYTKIKTCEPPSDVGNSAKFGDENRRCITMAKQQKGLPDQNGHTMEFGSMIIINVSLIQRWKTVLSIAWPI